jgi:hypothetical protein
MAAMTRNHPHDPDAGPAASGATSRPVPPAPPVPAYLAHRPTVGGLVVPWVTPRAADGRFLFGVIDPQRLAHCLTGHLCQVCGRRLERPVVLLLRERDLVRQCVSEPACHPVCAAYTARACPMVAGRMEHYRSAPVRLGEQMTHAPDTAARLGQPAEVWYAVWLDGYHTIIDPVNGLPAASFAGTRPRRVQTLPRLTDEQHDDPETEPLARYWLGDSDVVDAIGDRWDRDWLLGWRNITGQEKWRTLVSCVLPRTAVNHAFPLAFPRNRGYITLLQALWSSLVCDYVVRQKLAGTNLTFGIVGQVACPVPSAFDSPQPWYGAVTLREWVVPRVIELSYTSWRLRPYAVDNGDDGPPYRWLPQRRELIRAELDAAMFHVYGLTRPEVVHVLDSFFVVRKYEQRDHGEFRTKRLVLDRYDAMAEAARTGHPYQTILDPPPGHGPRHPARG